MSDISSVKSINSRAYQCLLADSVGEKIKLTDQTRQEWLNGDLDVRHDHSISPNCHAGWPAKPRLVPFTQLPKRTVTSPKGHAAMMHSFAHIEFNAINIAWDAVYRFADMPWDYYDDWSKVAAEEAYHFSLINDYLADLGFEYGSFDAHQGLWEMVESTKDDVMIRMALVPRVLEARGLDVTPDIISRFQHHGHDRAAEILSIIYQDEIGHVEIGSRWFNYLCDQRNINASETFSSLVSQYAIDKVRPPFNTEARTQAGFSKTEMEYLNQCTR